MDDELNEGEVYTLTLVDGEVLEGYTLYEKIGDGKIIVGYDGVHEDPGLTGIGFQRIIRLADVEEISPIG